MELSPVSVIEWKSRLELLDAEKKAEYDEGERNKKENTQAIQDLNTEIRKLHRFIREHGWEERLLQEATEGRVGSKLSNEVYPSQVLEMKRQKLCDLTNHLNMLRALIRQKTEKLKNLEETCKEPAAERKHNEKRNIPISQEMQKLNNQLDCVTKRQLEVKVLTAKYLRMKGSLQLEQFGYESRLELIRQRLQESDGSVKKLTESRQFAQTVHSRALQRLSELQRNSHLGRRDRDASLQQCKQASEAQKVEYQLLVRRVFGDSPAAGTSEAEAESQLEDDNQPEEGTMPQSATDIPACLGVSSMKEVSQLFEMQLDTRERLNVLRNETEQQIRQLKGQKVYHQQGLDNITYVAGLNRDKMTEETDILRKKIQQMEEDRRRMSKDADRIASVVSACKLPFLEIVQTLQNSEAYQSNTALVNDVGLSGLVDRLGQLLNDRLEQLDTNRAGSAAGRKGTDLTDGGSPEKTGFINQLTPADKKPFLSVLDRTDQPTQVPVIPTRQQLKRQAKELVEARAFKPRTPSIVGGKPG